MDDERSWAERALPHYDLNASRIRIVARDEAQEAEADMRLLFPHEPVRQVPMGCPHVCLYTGRAPASAVEERIAEHLSVVEGRRIR